LPPATAESPSERRRPFGYKIIYHDLGEESKRQRRIIGEELEPAKADAVREPVSRVLRGESLRGIAFDFNKRGIKPAGGKKNGVRKIDKWQGSTLRRVLISPRIAGLREHNGEVVGKAVWPAIIDEATHDRLVGLLKDSSRRPLNYGRPRVHPLVACSTAGLARDLWVTSLQPKQSRGYGCRKDENLVCPGRVRIAAEPLVAYIESYVIDQWRNPEAIKIAQSDEDRMVRIRPSAVLIHWPAAASVTSPAAFPTTASKITALAASAAVRLAQHKAKRL
jgi:site-specific DNA recombinase